MNGILSVFFLPRALSATTTQNAGQEKTLKKILQETTYLLSPENVGMTKTTNDVDAADAKRDEAEEINIFIALPGGNASKFKVDCPMQQAAADHHCAMMIVSRCESLDPYLKRGPCHA